MSVKIFFSYAHEDEALLNKLKSHLKPLQWEGLIDIWYDRDISAGREWEQEISKHLNEADIILLLLSPDFMNSDYCYSEEVLRAIERHKLGQARAIPVIVRPIFWQKTILGTLQALPTDAKAVTLWKNRDFACVNITEGIRKTIEELQVKPVANQAAHAKFTKSGKTIASKKTIKREQARKEPMLLSAATQGGRPGRILVVDDIQAWREELAHALRKRGFYVDAVASSNEALAKLDKALYHLLITDIRQSETDPHDIGGMLLLREMEKRGLSQGIKTMINSAYYTKEFVREAFEVHKVLDFFPKEEFEHIKFADSVQQAFTDKIKINLALQIHWQEIIGPGQALLNLEVEGSYVKQDTPLQVQMAAELEDLLCRLFYRATSVLVRPLTQGSSASGVVQVIPYYATGGSGHEVVVKFGDCHKIEEEYRNFTEYVQPFLGGARGTIALEMRRTPHLSGITYALFGSTNGPWVDFGDLYHRANLSQIKNALDRLFMDTCAVWYANHGPLRPLNLTEEYQKLFVYDPDTIEQVLSEQYTAVKGKHKLYFRSLKENRGRPFTNPLRAVAGRVFVSSTYTCITHGDFNQHNLLVDNTGHIWLTDFQATSESHILRDVAILDAIIRFHLLSAKAADLEERLKMEEALTHIDRFSQVEQLVTTFATHNQALAKSYATVVHLRTWARTLLEQNPNDDISEYYIALLYIALNTLRLTSLPLLQREHALLSASLLVDRLGLGSKSG